MRSFYESFEHDDAELIESLSRVVYELRENRKALLTQHGVADEAALLSSLSAGETLEHPSYEHYLSARILAEMHEAVREELAALLQEVKPV